MIKLSYSYLFGLLNIRNADSPLVWPEPCVCRGQVLCLVFIQLIKLHGKPSEAKVEMEILRHAAWPPHHLGRGGVATVQSLSPLTKQVM